MPRGDRTGPVGSGPMTGRMMGFCPGFSKHGFNNPTGFYGRGFRGRGFGHNYYATSLPGWIRENQIGLDFPPSEPTMDTEQKKELLQNQVKNLKQYLKCLEEELLKTEED